MLNHVVLFQFKEGSAPDAIKKLVDGLRAMPATISEIVSLSCGEDIDNGTRGGYQLGLIVQLKSREDLPAYLNHATHKALVKDLLQPVLESLAVVDYDV
jgi:hypothetical protein